MSTVVVIPARGGSKGLPRKNTMKMAGKPMIAYAIEESLKAEHVHKVVVSSDDMETLLIAKRYGADTIRRPPRLASDTASSEDVLSHALSEMENVEKVVMVQCTSPLVLAEDIDGCLVEMVIGSADSCFAVSRSHRYTWTNGCTYENKRQPRQNTSDPEYNPRWLEAGSVYAMDAEIFLREQNRFCGFIAMYEIDPERNFEVDNAFDFELCEWLIEKRNRK